MLARLLLLSSLLIPVLCSAADNQPNKYGYIDSTGKVVLACQWDHATQFHNGRASVERNGKWAIINKTGKPLTDFKWDKPIYISKNSLGLTTIGEKHGLLNKQGKVILKATWNKIEVRDYYKSIRAESHNQVVHFDFAGNELFRHEKTSALEQHNRIFLQDAFIKGKKPSIYIVGNKLLYQHLDSIEFTSSGILFSKNHRHGYISFSSTLHIPLGDHKVTSYKNNYCAIHTEKMDTLVSPTGKRVTFNTHSITAHSSGFQQELLAVEDRKTNKTGFANSTGKIIHQCIWDNVKAFEHGLARVESKGKWGAINESGELVIPTVWDGIEIYEPNMIEVQKDTRFGTVNREGEVLIKPVWDELGYGPFENTWENKANNLRGILDVKGKQLVATKWEEFDDSSDTCASATKGGKKTVFKHDGTPLSEQVWDDVRTFKHGVGIKKNNKLGIINLKGDVVLKPEWDWCPPTQKGKFIIAGKEGDNQNSWTLFKPDGQPNSPRTWDSIEDLAEGPYINAMIGHSYFHGFLVQKFVDDDVLEGYIDKHGKLTIPCSYLEIDLYSDNGIFAVEDNNGLFGFRDTTGKWITPLKWQNASSFNEGLAPVQMPAKP